LKRLKRFIAKANFSSLKDQYLIAGTRNQVRFDLNAEGRRIVVDYGAAPRRLEPLIGFFAQFLTQARQSVSVRGSP
jgi:hypothetical protein